MIFLRNLLTILKSSRNEEDSALSRGAVTRLGGVAVRGADGAEVAGVCFWKDLFLQAFVVGKGAGT